MLRDLTFEAMQQTTLHKKWNFPLMISSVNVTKSSGDDAFGQICWKNPWLKTSFLRSATCRIWYQKFTFETCKEYI